MAQAIATTLFDKLGGTAAIEVVVKEFYERVLGDAALKGYFANTNMDRQIQQLTRFLCMALGGPNDYDGKPVRETHEHMGITEHHFDLVAQHLVAALKWAGVCEDDVNEIVSIVAPLKKQIVTA